ncbi:MAG: Na(+)-translocating NADH-quinone reductase subunit C [Acidobacteria bacterium]|nr:Na(+)-translocating NADH-quinone reductase subunit C [Acidobacteriota bacterium]
MQRNATYVLGFAAIVCVVCAVVVSSAAVVLKDRQDANLAAYREQNVLEAAGFSEPGQPLSGDELTAAAARLTPVVIDLDTGDLNATVDVATFDQRRASTDPATSRSVDANQARIVRIPNQALVYELRDDAGNLDGVVLPIEGKGLWSTLYGFVALEADLTTIRGLTYFEQKETAGLGGEVDNPRWKALWPGRRAFDETGATAIEVLKGAAGTVEEAPYEVDGLSGATITSRGVTYMLQFWLGDEGFGPYLDRLREETI